jgi:hypothetical protein
MYPFLGANVPDPFSSFERSLQVRKHPVLTFPPIHHQT